MTDKYTRKCATSLVIREMKIKITMRYHLNFVRTAKNQKTETNKCLLDYPKIREVE